jgi:hypothetical protein
MTLKAHLFLLHSLLFLACFQSIDAEVAPHSHDYMVYPVYMGLVTIYGSHNCMLLVITHCDPS